MNPSAPVARPGWGWIEGFILSQTFLPGLLFVPSLSSVRPAVRISSYLTGVLAWVWFLYQGKSTAPATTFPARPWLIVTGAWLALSLIHPNIYSVPAAVGQMMLYFSVFSPAFWAGESVTSSRQLSRIMAVLFLCNALSASVGLAQVFSDRFYPPVIPVAMDGFGGEALKIDVAGRRIFRPCGLTDSPGAAAPAGATAALIGLCFALRPIGVLRRLVCAGLAFIGVAVIYYTQIRSTLLVLVICLAALTVLLFIQGRTANALTLVLGSVGMVAGSLLWVARRMGTEVFKRFGTLVSPNVAGSIKESRGGFVWEALTQTVWDNPLGYGLGWWGMVHVMFINPARVSTVWVEVMISAWAIDGGFVLMVAYCGAVVVAALNALRIATRCKDRDVAFWGAVVFSQNLSVLALCFSYPAFLSPVGIQFWLLSGAVHAADVLSRSRSTNPSAAARPRRRLIRPWPPGRAAT